MVGRGRAQRLGCHVLEFARGIAIVGVPYNGLGEYSKMISVLPFFNCSTLPFYIGYFSLYQKMHTPTIPLE